MPFSPLDEGLRIVRQLDLSGQLLNAANRQSTRWLTLIGTIITTRSRFGLYRSLFNSSLSDKLGEPV